MEQQYQATVEIVLRERGVGRTLLGERAGVDWAGAIRTLHAYPVAACYTSVYAGRTTLVGLRGYAAHQAIRALGADNQTEPGLLEWMYGPVARGRRIGRTRVNLTVAERLVAFAREHARDGVPGAVGHEAKRLLLNQLKASVGATGHEVVRILHDWAGATGGEGNAQVLWLGTPDAAGPARRW